MRRWLTLAPTIKAKLRPRLPSSSVIKDSLLDTDYTSARAELSAIVESGAAICSKPPAKHGMEFPSSKFWHGNMDSDESDEEVDEEIVVEEEGNPSVNIRLICALVVRFVMSDCQRDPQPRLSL
jgi:hypothetical protein